MSIKLLAIELYRAQQNVERLVDEIGVRESLSDPAATAQLQENLRQARAEFQQLRKMLDDKKSSSSPKSFSSRFAS